MRKPILLCCWLLAATWPVGAQNNLWATFEQFGQKEGYQNYSSPGKITRDKEGLLWIGSDNGLYSFDGTHFTNYRHIAGNDSSLPRNVVSFNYQDKQGQYWTALPNAGLYRFNPITRAFRRFTYQGIEQFNIHQQRIYDIYEEGEKLWFILPGYGLACWDRTTATMKHYPNRMAGSGATYYSTSWITTMVKSKTDNTYWIGSNDGLLQFDPATGSWQTFRPDPLSTIDGRNMGSIFNQLYLEADGTLWCGSWGRGLLRFNTREKKFTASYTWKQGIAGSRNICSGLWKANEHQLWVCTLDYGLLLFDKRSASFRKTRSIEKPDGALAVNSSYPTSPYNMWVVDNKNLYRINVDTTRFRWYQVIDQASQPTTPGGIYNFIRQGYKVYTGAFYDGHFGYYDLQQQRFVKRQLSTTRDNEAPLHLSQDRQGIIWVCTQQGTYWYDPYQERLLTPPLIDSSDQYFRSHGRRSLHARNGSHWLATNKGLLYYDPVKRTTTVFDSLQPPRHRIRSQWVYELYEDSKGRIWIGTLTEGVFCYLPQQDTLINIRQPNLPSEKCIAVREDKAGNILYILESTGLVVLEQPFTAQQRSYLYNSSNDLPTDYINSIHIDTKGRVWLNTANGLVLFNPATRSHIAFRRQDGLWDNAIDSRLYQDSSGLMYIGFNYGYQTFHPDTLLKHTDQPFYVRLSSLEIDGQQQALHAAYNNGITLAPTQNNISFSFAAISPSLTGQYKYAYLLEGVDKDWNQTGSATTGQYSYLPPGNYRLRIRAAGNNEAWSVNEWQMPFVVLPAWYQTTWFRILAAALLAGLVYALFRYRLKKVRLEAALTENYHKRIKELEIRSLRAQMNPHFIFNSLSSINRYIVKSDHKMASNYLTRFSRLIRQILDNSAADSISLETELETLELYIEMEKLRFDEAFTYEIIVDERIHAADTFIPPMLLQPYVENAIWHGLLHREDGHGKLTIRLLHKSDALLEAQIEDNGVGRQKAMEMKSREAIRTKSYGMQLSQDRLQLLGQQKDSASVVIDDLTDAAGKPGGTRVILYIPIQNITA
ncbi:sensor histidine kinase [Paraflavitalea sp. CAU 1676]|uniref:sensor histidine kinase n=1 Tax=Paraflavitalea sp. CAU 1676 TaxID=3032598 RepID=UPI0023DC9327|nr:sensor histidine kinase [Paraflavitalea sp. CAU 1676]MDF2189041.1 histidine kinase [Paraflavitalea sp. CAU 1676]